MQYAEPIQPGQIRVTDGDIIGTVRPARPRRSIRPVHKKCLIGF
jgi:hypothetical protein